MEGLGESGGGAEAVVGAVEIGEAVGDEDSGQNVEPAFAHLGLCPECASGGMEGVVCRVLDDGLHRGVSVLRENGSGAMMAEVNYRQYSTKPTGWTGRLSYYFGIE